MKTTIAREIMANTEIVQPHWIDTAWIYDSASRMGVYLTVCAAMTARGHSLAEAARAAGRAQRSMNL